MNGGPQVDAPTEEIPGAWASLVAAARVSRRDAAALEEWTGEQTAAAAALLAGLSAELDPWPPVDL